MFQVAQAANAVVTAQQVVAQAITHGFSQGLISAAQGGKFGSSFSSAALSSLLSSGFLKYGGSLKDNTAVIVSFSTVSGGGVSVLTGGNFWQGAATAFYVSMLNHAAHDMTVDGGDQDQIRKMGPDNGAQVMDSANTWWGRLWNTLEPRIYTDPNSGMRFQVDANGKVLRVEPVGGRGAMGLIGGVGGGFKVSEIAGFYVRAKSVLSGSTYTKTVQSLGSLKEGTSLVKLVKAFEIEARSVGANRIVIKGVEIMETRLIQNISFMKKLGYTVEKTTETSIKISKNF